MRTPPADTKEDSLPHLISICRGACAAGVGLLSPDRDFLPCKALVRVASLLIQVTLLLEAMLIPQQRLNGCCPGDITRTSEKRLDATHTHVHRQRGWKMHSGDTTAGTARDEPL